MRNTVVKNILLAILIVAVSLVVVTGAIGIWAFHNPVKAFNLVQEHILPENLDLTWDALDIETTYEGGLNFSFQFNSKNLIVQKEKPALYASFETIDLNATLYFSKNLPHKIKQIRVIANDEITFRPETASTKGRTEQSFYQQVQNPLRQIAFLKEKVSLGEINIQIPSIKIDSKSPVNVSLVMVSTQSDEIGIQSQIEAAQAKLDLNLKLFSKGEDAPLLLGDIDLVSTPINSKLNIKSFYNSDSVRLLLEGSVETKLGRPLKATPQLIVELREDDVTLDLKTDIQGQVGPFKGLKDVKVTATIPQSNDILWSEDVTKSTVSSTVDLLFINQKIVKQIEHSCDCQLPKAVRIRLNSDIWLSRLMSETNETSDVANIKVEIEKIENKLFYIELLAELLVQKESTQYLFTPNLNSTIDISSFQSVVKILASNNVLIPTPFNTLDGTVNIRSRGAAEATPQYSEIPLEVSLDLASQNQKVKLNSTAVMSLHRSLQKAELSVDASIDAIDLILPPLDPIRGTPRVVKDARILQTPEETKESKFQMDVKFDVKTTSNGAIRLFHEYFVPHLPLTLNLTSNPSIKSFLKVEPFDVVYLRRKVSLERMTLDLTQTDEDEEALPVDARLRVEQTQYTVFIDIKGNLKEPQVVLSSEPALSEDDIVAVLLYDQTRSELGAGDAENSSGVQSAIADRAIGLFGLWAFAATPIKRFSYNPVTKVYSAAIEVSDSVTAEIGTNWEETTNLELHKRLSRRWVLTAAWTPATTDTKATQKLMLQ